MAERRKVKKRVQEVPADEESKASKIEYDVAKYMKSSVPQKRTKFLNHPVNYFIGSKAIDALLESQWATGENALFNDRESVVYFCNKMLQHKFFHRARKIAVTDRDLSTKELKKKRKVSKKKDDSSDSPKVDKHTDEETKKKKKTRIKLDMHLEQVFIDSSDAYVWMYDPIPFWYYIVGGILLFGAVGVCLFPLWPPIVRQCVYYLSMAGAGFLLVILSLTVLRFIIFSVIWTLSLGKHHFWILPNLTEDVGFLASFWPLYDYEYRGKFYDPDKSSKKKKDLKPSKAVKEDLIASKEESRTEAEGDDIIDSQSANDTDKPETDAERLQDQPRSATEESDSENCNSHTFELVDSEDLHNDSATATDKENS